MAKVKSITLMFNNCESIEVSMKYIGHFFIGDIQANIERTSRLNIETKDTVKEFFIELFKEGNTYYDGLYGCPLFERLYKYPDLKMIAIEYDNEHIQYLYLPWDGARNNRYQNNWVSKLGNLYICVSERKVVEDYIDEHDANNSTDVELRKVPEIKPIKKRELDDYLEEVS